MGATRPETVMEFFNASDYSRIGMRMDATDANVHKRKFKGPVLFLRGLRVMVRHSCPDGMYLVDIMSLLIKQMLIEDSFRNLEEINDGCIYSEKDFFASYRLDESSVCTIALVDIQCYDDKVFVLRSDA